ncbi:glycosyltransferase sugar-binding containing DXD motif domain-containing protein [Hirsutella rhossiliensis]|uniref:Glycosyltransferase sugar-binding containing DXD motif domain-containing protein n=1 Tax=Hirsutella rhossiliensis TaxID=111463 RepID=A0A9P8N3L6_9HYPO|nr:glycosyltransferase sugar-binding containing DXD motif domain-containing protein [Hirsutella rhossiliensis]KAH0966204.1 glycosyltransferase sugar-binding containing DXD motif domain-containing protein [Hirsutella rhossiliensis]
MAAKTKFYNLLWRVGVGVCIIVLLANFRLHSDPPSNIEHTLSHISTNQDTQQATVNSLQASSLSTTSTTISSVPGTIPGIPGKVWQSAKDRNFTNDQQTIIDSWLQKNPNFRYELLTDQSAENYVIARYNESRPDIVALYLALPIAILRADLLRYLILLSEGGIWSDIDVTCEVGVGHWLPAEIYHTAPNISLIVGLEFDIPSDEARPVYSQLTNWVFAARPGSSHLLYVVNSVVKELYNIATENGVPPSGMGEKLSRMVDDRDIAGIKKPRFVGDVLVMPGAAFAALQNGFPQDQVEPLVSHHYAGSWKGPADEAREKRKKNKGEERKKVE